MLTGFDGGVAAITGAASGFGRAFATSAAALGMRLSLADIDSAALDTVASDLRSAGATVIAERVDVSVGEDVARFARSTREAFGQVDLLFNNAGVASVGPIWESTEADWGWVLGVNLWGVIHGIRHFVPAMMAQGTPGHVVNTASLAGLISPPSMAIYNVSKHAVVTLTETLHHDLKLASARIGASVLCPAFVPTGIGRSERNRAVSLPPRAERSVTRRAAERGLEKAVAAGHLDAADIAAQTFDAIRTDRFYIITHPSVRDAVIRRHRDIEEGRSPGDPMGDRTDHRWTDKR